MPSRIDPLESRACVLRIDGAACRVGLGPAAVDSVYRERADGAFAIERIVGVSSSSGAKAELTLEPGPWAISALDRRGVESRGARITVE